jgi:predicted CXXCH cytochrome family protein
MKSYLSIHNRCQATFLFVQRIASVLVAAVVVTTFVLTPSDAYSQRKKKCVDCHEDFKDKSKLEHVHDPFKDCETCHRRHGFSQKLVLVKAMPELCTECHDGVATEIESGSVHAALSEGSCTVCHDPHASDVAVLMRETEADMPVCMVCHTGLAGVMSRDDVHEPFAKRDCASCHEPHSSDRPSLLVAGEADVCATCHENALANHKFPGAADFSCGECHDPHVASSKSPTADFAHPPFAAGDCEDCHSLEDGEVAMEDDFPQDDLCETCHDDITALVSGGTSHFKTDPVATGGTTTCLTCHDHHSSRFGTLLTASEFDVCSQCHDGLQRPDGSIHMAFHEPYASGECSACHEPHGDGKGTLLTAETNDLCAQCHQVIAANIAADNSSHAALEMVECTECHSPHTSQSTALLGARPVETCYSCHEPTTFAHPHEPYSFGACGNCHLTHATTAGLLAADVNTTCRVCHAPQFKLLNAPVTHAPAREESCDFCHQSHGSDFAGMLNAPQSELCLDCHEMGDMTVTSAAAGEAAEMMLHQPVAEGDCGGCHNPHGAMIDGLLTREGAEVCYGCHTQEKISFAQGSVHQPVAEGDCQSCHTPHGGVFASLRAAEEPALCTKCHDFTVPPLDTSHQGFDVVSSKCTTCHNPHNSPGVHLLNAVAHEPFADDDCESCHESGTAVIASFEADMCFMCHGDLETGAGHQHAGDTECIDCHSPHTSRFEALLHNPAKLCSNCHEDVLMAKTEEGQSVTLHKPLENGDCLECHQLHDPPSEGFLVAGQETMCASCHPTIEARSTDLNKHDPFAKGKCSSCHATHAAAEAHLLKKEEDRLCKTCHRIGTEEMTQKHGGIKLSGDNCTTCHDPHSAAKAGGALMYANLHSPYEDGECEACHGEDGSVQADMTVCFDCHDEDEYKNVHNAGRTGDDLAQIDVCMDCHSPHAGHDNMFRRGSDLETCVQCHDRADFTRQTVHAALEEGCSACHDPHQNNFAALNSASLNDLCATCHEEAMTHAHPIGAEHKDPRNGLPLTCSSCHEPHSSDHEHMLTFDHRRNLCVQCHAPGTQKAAN